MHQLKAAGLIERFPNGERKHSLPPLSRNPIIRKAQRKLEERKAQMARGVVVPASDATKAEKLSTATDRSLGRVQEILDEEFDPREEFKQYQLQMNVALSVIASQVRLDAAALQAASGGIAGLDDADLDRRLDRLADRIDRIELTGDEIEAEDMADDDDVTDVGAENDGSPAEAAE
jgi:hypothetical protein